MSSTAPAPRFVPEVMTAAPMAGSFMRQLSALAPPGLEDAVIPSVPILSPAAPGWAGAPSRAPGAGLAAAAPAEPLPGVWMQAVLAASPYLSREGVRHALAIVDRAMRNSKRARTLDGLFGSVGGSQAERSLLRSAAYIRAEIDCEQRQLLEELQRLCVRHRVLEAAPPPAAAPAAPALPAADDIPAPPAHTADAPTAGALPIPGFLGELLGAQPLAKTLDVESADACPQDGRKAPEHAGEQASKPLRHTLTNILQALEQEDPDRLFIVRQINRLGFNSARALKGHYGAYGRVERILVADSTIRHPNSPDCMVKRRPGNLGFVKMASAEAVRAILAAGPQQEVDGLGIRVEKFGRLQEESIHEEHVNKQGHNPFERHTSSGSNHSLASASTCISSES